MKKFLLMLSIVTVFAGIIYTWFRISRSEEEYKLEAPLPFVDVLEGDWYFEYVSTAYNNKWFKGTGDKRFLPEQTLSRGDFAMVLYRYLDQPDVAGFENPFVDVPLAEHAHAVTYLYKLGVLSGKDETHYAPNEPITREAAVTVLYRLGGYKVHDEISPAGKFMDWDRTSLWAQDAMDWAVTCGFIEGTTSSILSPQAPITRAQFVKILCLFAEKTGDSKTNTVDPNRQVTIRVWQAGVDDSDTARIMSQLLNRFEKWNPGITVEYTPLPSGDKPYQKIATALKGEDAPDLLIVSAPYEMLLADSGSVLPLDTLVSKDALSDINAGLLLDCYYERTENPELRSRLVSVPITASPAALLMNKELFKHFGLSIPTGDYSYKRIRSDAKELTGSDDGKVIYGYGVRGSSPGQYLGFLWSDEQYLVEPRSRTAGTNTEAWQQHSEEFFTLYEKQITPDYQVSMDYYSLLSMFGNGSISMMSGSLEAAKLLSTREEWKDNLGIYPYTDSAEDAALCVGQVAVIPSGTKNVVEAASLLNFLLRSDIQSMYFEKSGELPSVMSAIELHELKNDPYYQPYIHGLEDTARLGDKALEAYTLLSKKFCSYLRGEMDVRTYCRTLTEELDRLLGNKSE